MDRPRPTIRARLRGTLLACVAAELLACDDGAGQRLTNVLLDTTRADRIGFYGGLSGVSPTIDALAANGARFTRAIATAGLTPMSHASILTGLNNYAHGIRVFHSQRVSHRLKDAVDTLPDGPWCMSVHLFDAHDLTLVPPPDFLRASGEDLSEDASGFEAGERLAWRERLYGPEIAFMDAQLARIVDWLRAHGQYGETIVVITADCGQGLRRGLESHGWTQHRLLYDWTVHVPLVVRIPGRRTDVRVVEAQVRTIDIAPTIADAVGASIRQPMEGDSLLPPLRGETEPRPRIAYADALNLGDTHSPTADRLPPNQHDDLFTASDGRWKLVRHGRNPAASDLYDLLLDPSERDNLYRPDHPSAAALDSFLTERHVDRLEPPGSGSVPPDVDALRSLGYIGDRGDDTDGPGDGR